MTIHPMSRIFSTPFTENILKEGRLLKKVTIQKLNMFNRIDYPLKQLMHVW